MKITILTVGNLKTEALKTLEREYLKRLGPYAKVEMIAVKEGRSALTRDLIKQEEAKNIMAKIPSKSFIVVMDEKGRSFDSVEFSQLLNKTASQGHHICFIIGGCYGLAEEVVKAGKLVLSFSAFTFTHEMVKILLLEQLYRSYTILNNKTYHY